MNNTQSFELSVEQSTLDNIYQRVAAYPWHEMPVDASIGLHYIIEPLAHPARFGRQAEDSFTIVAPSLPGFGAGPAQHG